MRFGNYKRVVFDKNTIDEVICQIRYPAILKISKDISDFQDEIRNDYPEMHVIGAGPDMPDPLLNMLISSGKMPFKMNTFKFTDESGNWAINICNDFLSLTCSLYTEFGEFSDRFSKVLKVFEDQFKPNYYNRLGLRYRNLIIKEYLDAEDVGWLELVAPEIMPELIEPNFKDKIQMFEKKILFQEGNEKANALYSLIEGDFVFRGKEYENEEVYVIDIDCFTEEKIYEDQTIHKHIGEFNLCVRDLFRKGISRKLYALMGPTDSK